MIVAAEQQDDPGAQSDAPDPDDLVRHVRKLEPFQKVPPIGLEGAPVAAQDLARLLFEVFTGDALVKLLHRDDEGRIMEDAPPAVDLVGQLLVGMQAVLRPRLREVALGRLQVPVLHLRAEPLEDLLDVEARVPDFQVAERREGRHRLSVLADGREDDVGASRLREAVVAPGHFHARGEPLHVPVPRSRERLVEIVDVEHHAPLGGAEHSEVREVRVAAELSPEPRARGGGQIGGHHARGAPVERERGDQHPTVADRHQLGRAGLRLLLQQRDRIGPLGERSPGRVTGARHLRALRLAASRALLGGEVRHHPLRRDRR